MTIGALIGMAAHADGLHVSVLDMAGLAQKGGSVWSHVRIAAAADALQGLHVGAGQADCCSPATWSLRRGMRRSRCCAAGRRAWC